MKFRNLILTLTAVMGLCACGTTAVTSTETPVTNIVAQTDPLVIELDAFENCPFGSDRAYIVICNNTVKGQIPTVNGMVTIMRPAFSSRYALRFDNCSAKVSEPKLNKKGTRYSFTVNVDGAHFFDSVRDTDWRLSFTIDGGGSVTLRISSTSISQVRHTSTWSLQGHVNVERTEAMKMLNNK